MRIKSIALSCLLLITLHTAHAATALRQAQNKADWYVNHSYTYAVAEPAKEILNALALTANNTYLQKLLHGAGLATAAAEGTAYTINSLAPTSPEEHRSNRIFGLIHGLNSLKSAGTQASLIKNSGKVLEKLHTIELDERKKIRNTRIKNALIKVLIALAISKVVRPHAGDIVYRLVKAIAEMGVLDRKGARTNLERSLIKDIEGESS
ncbi:MAG: hypothetical protein QG604_677 [Candidatus Dependentiae bacterium]|nr:hypothetical protein [Candidatus Dependentiae bacterium]